MAEIYLYGQDYQSWASYFKNVIYYILLVTFATAVKIKVKKPASQRTSSVSESEQPTCYANTTINTNVVDEVLWFSLWKMIMCKMLVGRKLCYSQSLAGNVAVKRSSIIFQRKWAILHLDRVLPW